MDTSLSRFSEQTMEKFFNTNRVVSKVVNSIIGDIRSDDVILDIGSCVGSFSNLLLERLSKNKKMVFTGTIVLFEPTEVYSEFSRKKLSSLHPNNNFRYVTKALDEESGVRLLNYPNNPSNIGGSSFINHKGLNTIEIRTTTFLEWWSIESISRIDVVKIDVENYEHIVIAELLKFCEITKIFPRLIQAEIFDKRLNPHTEETKQVLRKLSKYYSVPDYLFKDTYEINDHVFKLL